MLYKEILVKKILDGNQYVQRNKIREHSILKFFREENEEDDFVLMVDNKLTTQHLTKLFFCLFKGVFNENQKIS